MGLDLFGDPHRRLLSLALHQPTTRGRHFSALAACIGPKTCVVRAAFLAVARGAVVHSVLDRCRVNRTLLDRRVCSPAQHCTDCGRFGQHVEGEGGRFTCRNRPVELVYVEEVGGKEEAERRESQIKRWSRAKKEALIKSNLKELRRLSVSRD